MKRIINGKCYNTETAELLTSAESDCDRSNFSWWSEELYRTKKGRYFLAGEGHANSSWASHYDNSRGPGSGIRLLTEPEAREWVERYANTEYEEIFGATEEG